MESLAPFSEPAGNTTSPSLLASVLARDSVAWERMVHLYGPLVYRWSRCSGLQDTDAADIVQEVFSAVARSLDTYHPEGRDSFRRWLWGITRNKIRDHFRRQSSRPEAQGGSDAQERLRQVAESPPESTTDHPAFDAEAALLHRAVSIIRGDFDDRTWQAFWRATVQGHSGPDIARDLEMTPRAVRQAKYRVLRRLRQEMGDLPHPT